MVLAETRRVHAGRWRTATSFYDFELGGKKPTKEKYPTKVAAWSCLSHINGLLRVLYEQLGGGCGRSNH